MVLQIDQLDSNTFTSTLLFNADFESGNIGKVKQVSDIEYDIWLRPDSANDRHRLWFHFAVSNAQPGQRVILNLINFSKIKSLYRNGASPVVRSLQRPQWARIPSSNIFYYISPRHKKRYVLSIAFSFDSADDVYYFAYSVPYLYSQLQTYLDHLEAQDYPFLARTLLGESVEKRRLDLVTITSPTSDVFEKKTIVITSRVHPGETPSSWVCQGILGFLCSDHPRAQQLRATTVIYIIPMLNPDGVVLGNYRSNALGFDLNRQWRDPSPTTHPTIHLTKLLLSRLNPHLYIDIHAHSTQPNTFIYGNPTESPPTVDDDFVRVMKGAVRGFDLEGCRWDRDEGKRGTGRR
ncbi:Cytosolic carboxypeptidase 6 [Rhizophlyctis rosea]|uniref:Cytosolic carboxypeptidase 6 n=1 Tax=Rhizophlyctis rosea TaxID=64517 RepID=A0AAD5X0Q6_9FUNG|nr:Cytosolic carboxypeptidase 6 [Rhizophlyctis rosea]